MKYVIVFLIAVMAGMLIGRLAFAEPNCKPITEDTYKLHADMCVLTYKQRGYDEKQTSCICNIQDQNLRRVVVRKKLTCENEIRYSWFALTTAQKEMCVR